MVDSIGMLNSYQQEIEKEGLNIGTDYRFKVQYGSRVPMFKILNKVLSIYSCSSSNCKTKQRNRKELFFVALPKRQNNVARSYFLLLCQGDKEMFL